MKPIPKGFHLGAMYPSLVKQFAGLELDSKVVETWQACNEAITLLYMQNCVTTVSVSKLRGSLSRQIRRALEDLAKTRPRAEKAAKTARPLQA
jgi:hypothetical protein